jgi:D-alanine-D-alanine ligase
MSTKRKIAVIMGGKTPEYEISLISGREVVKNLDKNKYKVLPVIISRDGERWYPLAPSRLLSLGDPLKLKDTGREIIPQSEEKIQDSRQILEGNIDVVFIAMHGPFGEDGTIQGMLELAGLKYTGSGVLASALGMNKIMFKRVMQAQKIPIPKYVVVDKKDSASKVSKVLGKPPYFIKPSSQGSSVGTSIARNFKELKKGLKEAFSYGPKVIVEEYIVGTEVTCPILGNDRPSALPLIEIVPLKGEYFDYESKYTESGAEEIVPARISKALSRKVQKIAIDVFASVGCRGFARVDFLIDKQNRPYVLEVNTIPGLTPMSLFPKSAKAAGISYSQLLDKILNYASR